MKPLTAESVEWRYEVAPVGRKVLLLTTGGICVTGGWYGEYGQAFIAWSPMLKRNHKLELELWKGRRK